MMKKIGIVACAVAVVSAGFVQGQEVKQPLLCYVGGTMRPAMEAIAKQYTEKTGQKVDIDFADSGQLLVKIKETQKGDLYVSHDPFPGAVLKQGIGTQNWDVATMIPVIVVPKGNPKKITGLRDLTKPGVKVIMTHRNYSTTGHMVLKMAAKAGFEKELLTNVVTEVRGGSEAANAVGLGTADASIVWNAVAFLRSDKLDSIPIEQDIRLQPEVDAVTTATYGKIEMSRAMVAVSLLKFSKNEAAARAFAGYVASEEGLKIWLKQGFLSVKPQEKQEPAK